MEVPRSDSTDPLIFKISQIFNFHNFAEEQRIQIVSFHLDGPVLKWYQLMFCNNQLNTWLNFLHVLQL